MSGTALEGPHSRHKALHFWKQGYSRDYAAITGLPISNSPVSLGCGLSLMILPAAERVLASLAASLGGRCSVLGEMALFSRDAFAAFACDLATPFLTH